MDRSGQASGCLDAHSASAKPAEASAQTLAYTCAAAPSLPCYYYHIPSMTGVDVKVIDLVRAIEPLSPSFAGVKYTGMYTSPGMMDAQRVLEYKGGKYEVLSGREEQMLQALPWVLQSVHRSAPR